MSESEKKPSITLTQWLSVDSRRRAPIRAECGQVVVALIGESLTWRGAGKDETQAINRALLAREKIHGAAL